MVKESCFAYAPARAAAVLRCPYRAVLHVLLWKSTFLVPLAFAWDVPLCMYAFGVVTPWVLICFPVAKIPCFCGASVCFCVLLCASVCFCAASVWPYLGSNGSYGPAKMIKMQMQASTSTFLGGKGRIFSKKKFFSSKIYFGSSLCPQITRKELFLFRLDFMSLGVPSCGLFPSPLVLCCFCCFCAASVASALL